MKIPARRVLHRHLAGAAALGVAVLAVGSSVPATAAGPDAVRTASASTTAVAPASAPAVLPGQDVSRAIAGSPVNGVAAPTQFWKQDISRAPLAKNSKALAANVAKQVKDHWGGVAAFNLSKFGTSTYTVPAQQPRVDVNFWDCQGKGHTPSALYGEGGQFVSVPVPAYALPAQGTDMHLSIWQPSTDTLWEFWKAQKRADGWYACWGGRIDGFSRSDGSFTGSFGAAASGLAIAPGSIRADEVRAGRIDHAMSLQLISPKEWKTFSWPAVRSDGTSKDPAAVAEGQRLRLDPSVDVDRLGLHPVARAVAKAAQTYGFVVTDAAGAVAVVGENGDGALAVAGTNPWSGLLGKTPQYAVMKGFPWEKVQVLPMDYGKPTAGGTAPVAAVCPA